MSDRRETAIAFGPVGIGGWVLLVVGVFSRRRVLALLGLAAVVADVTVADLGRLQAKNAAPTVEPGLPTAGS